MHNNMRMLLQLIKTNADIGYLIKQNLTYSQISAFLGEAVKQGWIDCHDSIFRVTILGEQVLQEDIKNKTLGNQSRWISADERYVIPQVNIDDVFLPKKKDSYFF